MQNTTTCFIRIKITLVSLRYVNRLIEKFRPSSKRILDLGCGTEAGMTLYSLKTDMM